MELGFMITNDRASYVAKEDSICLFSVASEAVLNGRQKKPCVPFSKVKMSAKLKYDQNQNVSKTRMSQELKCHQN